MSEKKEQYFPITRKFAHKVARWEKLDCGNLPGYRLIPSKLLSVIEYTLPQTAALPAGKTIAFLSDLHFHQSAKSSRIVGQMLQILENYAPDYLLLGGDMTGDAIDIEPLNSVLSKLRRVCGKCFAVGGNWEYGKEWLAADFWKEFYRKHDIVYLQNEIIEDGGMVFCGVADICSGRSALPELDMNKYNIMLAHNPDTALALDRSKLKYYPQLVLSGHTHGGQVNIPFLNTPVHIHSRYGNTFAHGIFRHRKRGSLLMVSAGLSELSFPWRFNCRRELLILRTGGTANE